jgi:hypothetical protein
MTRTNTPAKKTTTRTWCFAAAVVVTIIIVAAAGGNSNKNPTATSTAAPAVTHAAAADGGPGVTAEEAFNMEAGCETVHADEHAKCESMYAQQKSATPAVQSDGTTNACHGVASAACDEQISHEAAAAETVLKSRQAERTASQLEAISEASENE